MSLKHLAEDSIEPPIQEGKLRLYSMRFCPYAHRVHLILNAKNVPYDPVFINLVRKPSWYLERFPAGKVPSLIFNGEFLYESLLLADFLNEQYPNPPLYPSDPLKKLKDKLLIEHFNKVTVLWYRLIMKNESEAIDEFISGIGEYEAELAKRGTPYFGGDRPGMVDYMIWPWFERFGSIPLIAGELFSLPWKSFPNLTEWEKSLAQDNAVIKHFLNHNVHAKHLQLRKQDNDDEAFNFLAS